MELLTTTDNVKRNTRPISGQILDTKIAIYIDESEQIDIKPRLGDALFLDVKRDPYKYDVLLNGGEYTDSKGREKTFKGLVASLNYFTYARIVKNNDLNVVSFANVYKENEYSSRVEHKEKVAAYNDAFMVADMYLQDCLRYLNDNVDKFPLYEGKGKMKANKVTYRVIGE